MLFNILYRAGERGVKCLPQSLSVFRGKNLYVGNCDFLYANKPCIINMGYCIHTAVPISHT